jgi:hypothetical protein
VDFVKCGAFLTPPFLLLDRNIDGREQKNKTPSRLFGKKNEG